jgi:hypothetical protein
VGPTGMSEVSFSPSGTNTAHSNDAPRKTMSRTPKAKLMSEARHKTARYMMPVFLLSTG